MSSDCVYCAITASTIPSGIWSTPKTVVLSILPSSYWPCISFKEACPPTPQFLSFLLQSLFSCGSKPVADLQASTHTHQGIAFHPLPFNPLLLVSHSRRSILEAACQQCNNKQLGIFTPEANLWEPRSLLKSQELESLRPYRQGRQTSL